MHRYVLRAVLFGLLALGIFGIVQCTQGAMDMINEDSM